MGMPEGADLLGILSFYSKNTCTCRYASRGTVWVSLFEHDTAYCVLLDFTTHWTLLGCPYSQFTSSIPCFYKSRYNLT